MTTTTEEAFARAAEAAYNADEISRLVIDNIGAFSKCRGKNLVFLVGPTDGGKSQTTNSVRYGPMKSKFDKEKKCISFLPSDDCPINLTQYPVAKTGDGKKSCSTVSQPYSVPDEVFGKDTIIIDPKGAFDSKNNPIEDAAATVLMELALKEAKSSKLVVVLNASETIQKEDIGTQRFAELYGQMILDDNAPTVFVFNRFRVPDGDDETRDKLDEMKFNSPARYEFIMSLLKESCSSTLASKQKNWRDAIERIQDKVKNVRGASADLRDDNDYKKELASHRFLRQLALAFELSEAKKRIRCINFQKFCLLSGSHGLLLNRQGTRSDSQHSSSESTILEL